MSDTPPPPLPPPPAPSPFTRLADFANRHRYHVPIEDSANVSVVIEHGSAEFAGDMLRQLRHVVAVERERDRRDLDAVLQLLRSEDVTDEELFGPRPTDTPDTP